MANLCSLAETRSCNTPTRLADAARAYLGVRWRHLGRSRFGIDCVGLILLAARDLGHQIEDVPEYRRGAFGYDIVQAIGARAVPASLAAIEEGHILLFRESIYPCHAGIVGASARHEGWALIHAHAKTGQVLEEPYGERWQQRATHAFRLPELI